MRSVGVGRTDAGTVRAYDGRAAARKSAAILRGIGRDLIREAHAARVGADRAAAEPVEPAVDPGAVAPQHQEGAAVEHGLRARLIAESGAPGAAVAVIAPALP